MKIVLIDKEEMQKIGGMGVYTERLTRYLKELKHTVYVVKFSNKKKREYNTFHVPYYFAESRSFVFLPTEDSLSIFKKYLSHLKPDIVYSAIGLSPLDFFLPSICHSLRIPIAGVWHMDFNKNAGIYQALVKSVFLVYLSYCKQLDLLHVFSNKLADFYTRKGIDQKKILILSNGVDPNLYKRKNKSKFAEKHKIKKGILFLGRITLQKNPQILIKSFLTLNPPPDTKLIIVGCGDLEKELREKYRDNRIIFTGLIKNEKEKIDIMNGCQIFVLPSRFEGVPLALLEAMSCRLACIVSDAGNNSEVLEGAGIVIPTSKLASQMPLALKIYLNYPILADHISEKGRIRILNHYSQEVNFGVLMHAFEKTISNFQNKNDNQIKPFDLNEALFEELKRLWKKAKQIGIRLFD